MQTIVRLDVNDMTSPDLRIYTKSSKFKIENNQQYLMDP